MYDRTEVFALLNQKSLSKKNESLTNVDVTHNMNETHWFQVWISCWRLETSRDGFRERGAVGHLCFSGPTQVWPIWLIVLKAWNYVPVMCNATSKFYRLWCRHWFYDCLRSSTEIKAFPISFSTTNGQFNFFLEFIAFSSGWEVLFVTFPWFLAFL